VEKGDVTAEEFISYILKEHRIDIIIHAAAQSHVGKAESANDTIY
jgi:dTDP-4-dehydrorhamnose reductase